MVGGKVLLYKRLKHPQFGYTGLISGKMKYGEHILDTAKREFKEETSLRASFSIVGDLHQIRKNDKEIVIEDGIFYVCYTNKVSGALRKKSDEGEYFWVNPDEIPHLRKIFKPSVEVIVDELMQRLDGAKSWDNKFIYEFEPEPEDY